MRYAICIWFLFCSIASAATHTKTIGTSTTADYDTIAAWASDLDDGTNGNAGGPDSNSAYSATEDAVGSLIDAAYTVANQTISGGGTVGLNSVTLQAASAVRHDGTFGSGCKITNSTGASQSTFILSGAVTYKFYDLEFDYTYVGNYGLLAHIYQHSTYTGYLTVQRCLFQNSTTTHTSGGLSEGVHYSNTSGAGATISNCVFLNFIRDSSSNGNGIYIAYSTSGATFYVDNNTCIGCRNGIRNDRTEGTRYLRNNISKDSAGYDYYGISSFDTHNNNYSSDAVGDVQTTQTLAQLFTDYASGDYTPVSGSDLIGHAADLVTTPTGVNIDAAQYDRDVGGVTWDVGALQSAAASGIVHDPIVTPNSGPIIFRGN